MRRAILVLGLVLVGASGCSGPEILQEVVLVDYDFQGGREDPAFDRLYGADAGLHWFSEGWARNPTDNGVWAVGPEGTARLFLLGRTCVLDIACSTTPDLAGRGQELTILVNGHEVGRLPVYWGWEIHSWRDTIPDEVLEQGYNRVTFRASVHRPEGGDQADPRPLAIFFRTIQARAQLGKRQLRKWDEVNAPVPAPEEWEVATLAGTAGSARRTDRVGADRNAGNPGGDLRPDVLVILMDAAWAGHFHCYGYERATSPVADELAAGGLRFETVFSNAPFTVIAVPSLLTGLPWRDHRVIRKGNALADTFTTLAEILRDAGYFTLAYSDNPFVSIASNVDQGFLEFEEVWKHPHHGKPGENPELVEKLIRRRSRKGFDGKPVFAYLHLMPPHAPYHPGPEHDLWRDPAYDGQVDGSAKYLDAINEQHLEVDPADRERIVSLYDGNLHRIDASVGRILADWRELGRQRDLLVILVSDHGEAFGEHGYYQHLVSVYDEMLHVPLILWPADQWSHLAGSTRQFFAITDVMPILLNRLGIDPPADIPLPRRFLTVLSDPRVGRSGVAARTTIHQHRFGLRTDRYLAIFNGFSEQELYDLHRDPAARRNLRQDQPKRYRELIGMLRGILLTGLPAVEVEEIEMDEQDLETLRSLGYL